MGQEWVHVQGREDEVAASGSHAHTHDTAAEDIAHLLPANDDVGECRGGQCHCVGRELGEASASRSSANRGRDWWWRTTQRFESCFVRRGLGH